MATKAKNKTSKTKKSANSSKTKGSSEQVVDVVAQAKAELQKLEANKIKEKQMGKTPKFSLTTFVGGCLLGVAVALLGSKTFPSIAAGESVGALEKQLPQILEPLAGGMKVKEIGKPEHVGNIYKFTIAFEGVEQPFTSYITGDAKTFFVEGIPVEDLLKNSEGQQNDAGDGQVSAANCESIDKNATPKLTAYIVADCPYGKQAQQVMLDAIKQAPEIAKNFQVRYFFQTINDDGTATAMHGESEGIEGLRQICIREEQAAKYWDYVGCYAASAGGAASSETCLKQTGVNVANVESCMKTASRGPKFARADNQAAEAAGVSGSPTFMINDAQKVQESNFGGRNANGLKNIVCCSSDNALPFCDTTLSNQAAAASGNC